MSQTADLCRTLFFFLNIMWTLGSVLFMLYWSLSEGWEREWFGAVATICFSAFHFELLTDTYTYDLCVGVYWVTPWWVCVSRCRISVTPWTWDIVLVPKSWNCMGIEPYHLLYMRCNYLEIYLKIMWELGKRKFLYFHQCERWEVFFSTMSLSLNHF